MLRVHAPVTRRRTVMWATILFTLTGCATYQPLPLPEHAATAHELSQLRGYADMHGPLSVDQVATLVLLNNPDLRSHATRHRVAQSQAAAASVIPNPVLGGSLGYLLSGAGDATAWTASISQDVTGLITLAPRREAAHANADAVDASLVWEAWQTVGKARLLVIDITQEEQQEAWQRDVSMRTAQREQLIEDALARGLVERSSVAADLAAARDARVTLNDLQQQLLTHRQQLAALLGLSPDVTLALKPLPPPAPATAERMDSELRTMTERRPDLLALRLGYRAQEATLRAAVLAQFPALNLGYAASQDNSRVRNGGPAITLELPVFDQHHAAVDEASATRQQLHDEYIARLASARDEVTSMYQRDALLATQRDTLVHAAASDDDTSRRAEEAAQARQVDVRTSTDFAVAALSRHVALAALDQRMLENEAGIDLALGHGMPSAMPPEETPP